MRVPRRITWLALWAALAPAFEATADDPVGAPAKVVVEPAHSTLAGRRATRQLIASATDPDGSTRDLTRALAWTSLDPAVATVTPGGRSCRSATARPRSWPGAVAWRRPRRSRSRGWTPRPVSFRNDVIPALSQASCNMGACHGTPTGKGGFRLSSGATCPTRTS